MKTIEKNRFAILAVFILIAIALGAWSFLTDAPPESNIASNVASIIAGLFIIPMVYKIAKEATGSVEAGLFSAALSIAIPLFLGMITGSYIGAHTAIKNGDRWVKIIFILVVLVSSIKILFFS